MSHGIEHAVAMRRRPVALLGLRMLMLSLLMLLSTGALADPAKAEQMLRMAKQVHATLTLNHQIAKMQLQAGQTNAAVITFHMEIVNATQLSAKLADLYSENLDTFHNGQYVNGTAQQKAISFNDTAKRYSQQVEMQLMFLTMQPTSQIDMMMVEMHMQSLATRLVDLEQAMIAAQQ